MLSGAKMSFILRIYLRCIQIDIHAACCLLKNTYARFVGIYIVQKVLVTNLSMSVI